MRGDNGDRKKSEIASGADPVHDTQNSLTKILIETTPPNPIFITKKNVSPESMVGITVVAPEHHSSYSGTEKTVSQSGGQEQSGLEVAYKLGRSIGP